MRKAKDEMRNEELWEIILEGTCFDEIPRCVCPVPFLPETVTTIYCNTKCWNPCYAFKNFSFIMDNCNVIGCDLESPCSDCLHKISDYKIIMQGLKAMYSKRTNVRMTMSKCKKFAKRNNKTVRALKQGREGRNSGE